MDSNTLSLESISRLRGKAAKLRRRHIDRLALLRLAETELGLALCMTDGRTIDGRVSVAARRLSTMIESGAGQ